MRLSQRPFGWGGAPKALMFALVNNVWIRVENSSPHLGLLKCWEVFQNHLLNPILFRAIDFMLDALATA